MSGMPPEDPGWDLSFLRVGALATLAATAVAAPVTGLAAGWDDALGVVLGAAVVTASFVVSGVACLVVDRDRVRARVLAAAPVPPTGFRLGPRGWRIASSAAIRNVLSPSSETRIMANARAASLVKLCRDKSAK